tara:strand:+ start:17545 stop:18819 length:1275 start_codon:yes stop_codon:yes gene_type:complete
MTEIAEARPAGRAYYRYYVLFILMIGQALSVVDRGLISVVMTNIQKDFHLNDTQLGLLGGTAFAIFYAAFGIPIARLADRTKRKNIFAASVTVWSLATAACGAAGGFASLFLARMGVGVGEAGGTPSSHSLLSDYFTKVELGRAIGFLSMGGALGVLGGHLLGTALVEVYGWRMVFYITGLPGVLLGLLTYISVREPERGRFLEPGHRRPRQAPLGETLQSLLRNKVYVGTVAGHTFALVTVQALLVWLYPLIERNFGMPKTEIGAYAAGVLLFCAMPSLFLGGVLCDLMAKRSLRWMSWLPAFFVAASIPFYYLMLGATSPLVFFGYLGAFNIFINLEAAPVFASIQANSDPSERALAVAVLAFCVTIVGYAITPVVVGTLSDTVFSSLGDRSLHAGLALIGGCALVSIGCFRYAGQHTPKRA